MATGGRVENILFQNAIPPERSDSGRRGFQTRALSAPRNREAALRKGQHVREEGRRDRDPGNLGSNRGEGAKGSKQPRFTPTWGGAGRRQRQEKEKPKEGMGP